MSICQKLSHVSLLSYKSPLSNRQANSKSLKRDELASRDCVNSLDRFAKLSLWFLTILDLVLLIKRGRLGADMCSETLMLTDHTWNAGLVKQLIRKKLEELSYRSTLSVRLLQIESTGLCYLVVRCRFWWYSCCCVVGLDKRKGTNAPVNQLRKQLVWSTDATEETPGKI